MKTITIEDRKKIYEKMLRWFEENKISDNYAGGFCFALIKSTNNKTLNRLIELKKYKPENTMCNNEYWFDRYDKDIRINILKEIINNIDNK